MADRDGWGWRGARFRSRPYSAERGSGLVLVVRRVRHGGEERVRRLSRVEPGVLHDDRHVGADHARVIGAPGNRLRILELVEADVPRPHRGYGHPVGADRIAAGEEDRDLHVSVLVARVQDAGCLVADELPLACGAPGRNVAFCDRPDLSSDAHRLPLLKNPPTPRPAAAAPARQVPPVAGGTRCFGTAGCLLRPRSRLCPTGRPDSPGRSCRPRLLQVRGGRGRPPRFGADGGTLSFTLAWNLSSSLRSPCSCNWRHSRVSRRPGLKPELDDARGAEDTYESDRQRGHQRSVP